MPIVPIVMGGGNYAIDAPPHSVINVNDFSSVENLASYLKYLMINPVCTMVIRSVQPLSFWG